MDRPRRCKGFFAVGVGLIVLGLVTAPASEGRAQELSGRITGDLTFAPFYELLLPQSPSLQPIPKTAEQAPQLVGLTTQLDLGLDFPGIAFDGTFLFSNLGLTLAWLSSDLRFLAREDRGVDRSVQKRTIVQNDFVKVLRAFPSRVPAGGTFEVLVIVEALQDLTGTSLTVTEEYPAGWRVEFIDPLGALVASNAARWTVSLGLPGSRAVIRYSVRVPEEALDTASIRGTIESALFPPLRFDDALEVLPPAPPTLPGRVRIRQDLLFSAVISGGVIVDPLSFRLLALHTQLFPQPGLSLANFLRFQNVGTSQTPSLRWSNLVQITGRTTGGMSVRTTLRFSDEPGSNPLAFDRGTLQIGGLPIAPGLSLGLSAVFDSQAVLRLRALPGWTAEFPGTEVRLQGELLFTDQPLRIEDFGVGLRVLGELVEGTLQIRDSYGTLLYDSGVPGDGIEEEHPLELVRRTVLLRFTLGPLDVQSLSRFGPVLADVDLDGAREKLADAKLLQQEVRVQRFLEAVLVSARLLYTAPTTTLEPPTLSLADAELTVVRGPFRWEAEARLSFDPLAFRTRLSFSLSF